MEALLSPPPEKEKCNPYDCGFMKPDVDFDAQTLLNEHRSALIGDHFNVSCLAQHSIQFPKRARAAGNGASSGSSCTTNDPDKSSSDSDDKSKLLEFDCDFESGNIGDVVHFRDSEYDATIRGDTGNPRHSIWFYFRVRGGVAGQKMVLHFSNYSKAKSLYSEGFTPLVRSQTKPLWTRLPEHSISWFKCNRHRRSCFTISFVFDRSGDSFYFAYSFPFTYSYLQKFLGDLEALRLPFCKRQLLARTVQQRRLDCLRVEELGPDLPSIEERPVVVISSRVHPGETPSSFVMDGLIEFLLSGHESAVFLRRNVTLFIVPMLNPDGVFLGNYRCTSLGVDLNRHWHHPDFTRHPTICALKYLLRQLDASNRLHFYLDLHGHTNSTDAFMYCNQSEPTPPPPPPQAAATTNRSGSGSGHNSSANHSRNPSMDEPASRMLAVLSDPEKMRPHSLRNNLTSILPRLLDLHCDSYSFSKTKFCGNPKKAGSARRAMEAILSGIPLCYTFEVSFWRSNVKHSMGSTAPQMLYTQETYRDQGRCMVVALADIFKVDAEKRGDLSQYNFRTRRFMKGDLRKKLQKANRQKAAREREEQKNVDPRHVASSGSAPPGK